MYTRGKNSDGAVMMKRLVGIGLLAFLSCLGITSCSPSGGGGGNFSNITITPSPSTIPVNSTVTFKASSDVSTWSLLGFAEADLGKPGSQVGGSTFVYTAPATPPVYPKNDMPAGVVTLQAQYGFSIGYGSISFTITAPVVTVGVSPATASVALGSTLTVLGYAVGDANNQMTVQVNGVPGGAADTGTIVPQGSTYGTFLYTAPAIMPASGSTINITVISKADPTKTQTAVITLH